MSKIKNELVLSLMRERIKLEIREYYGDAKWVELDKLIDRIMNHIESAAKQID